MKLKPFLSKHIRDDPQVLLIPFPELARGFEPLRVEWVAERERLEAVKHQEKEVVSQFEVDNTTKMSYLVIEVRYYAHIK